MQAATNRDGVTIEHAGTQCPVQINGSVDGVAFYFRARGNRWSLGIGKSSITDPVWYHEQEYKAHTPFAAGYMSEDEAEEFLFTCIDRYRAGEVSIKAAFDLVRAKATLAECDRNLDDAATSQDLRAAFQKVRPSLSRNVRDLTKAVEQSTH